MDRAKLKEMGITHILNTAAYKEYLQGRIDTRAEYYKEMNINYYGVLVMDEHRFDISKDLFPASEFIHKAWVTQKVRADTHTHTLNLSSIIYPTVTNCVWMNLFWVSFFFISPDKLLVHCIDGVSRSATFVLAYLMIHHEI